MRLPANMCLLDAVPFSADRYTTTSLGPGFPWDAAATVGEDDRRAGSLRSSLESCVRGVTGAAEPAGDELAELVLRVCVEPPSPLLR